MDIVSLWDYLPPLSLRVQLAWTKRKDFINAMSDRLSVIETDLLDFSRISVLIKTKSGKSKTIRILEVSLSIDFPEKPPSMTISSLSGGASTWVLDPAAYRYSPRWDAKRMCDELYQHALSSPIAWESPVV